MNWAELVESGTLKPRVKFKQVTTSVYAPWARDIVDGLREYGVRAIMRVRRVKHATEKDSNVEDLYRVMVPEDEYELAVRVYKSKIV